MNNKENNNFTFDILTMVVILLVILSLSMVTMANTVSSNLLSAICKVESNCEEDAVGDNGNAIGPYQIWEIYWKDAVEFNPSLRKNHTYEDCTNKEYAEQIVLAYWQRYATEKRIGRPVTDEDRARIHNGGPNGYKKKATLKYWKKVQKEL